MRPSDVRLFLGVMDSPVRASDERAAQARQRQASQRRADAHETALSDRLLIVVTRSETREPEWPRIKALIEGNEDPS